jgi:hypothetical protein
MRKARAGVYGHLFPLKINVLGDIYGYHRAVILEETLGFHRGIGVSSPGMAMSYTENCKIRDHALVIENIQHKVQERTKWNAK